MARLLGSGIVLRSLSSSSEVGTNSLLGCGVDGRERAVSAVVMDSSVVELDLTWADERFGEADLRMLDNDR
jgi:hypothetical protein